MADCARHPHCDRPADRVFCAGCERAIDRALADLPELWTRLHTILTPTGSAGQRVSGSRTPPLPIRLDVATLIDDVPGVLADWEDALRKTLGWRAKLDPAGPRGVRLQATVLWLRRALSPLLAGPAGADAGMEILELARRCRHALGETRLVHRLPAPCPSCDARALARDNGASDVQCAPKAGGCGRSWSEVEYARLVHVVANDVG